MAQLLSRHEMAYILMQLERSLFRFRWLWQMARGEQSVATKGPKRVSAFIYSASIFSCHHYDFRLRFMVPQQPHIVLSRGEWRREKTYTWASLGQPDVQVVTLLNKLRSMPWRYIGESKWDNNEAGLSQQWTVSVVDATIIFPCLDGGKGAQLSESHILIKLWY
jgi:hypothetical protein